MNFLKWKVHYNTTCTENMEKRLQSQVKCYSIEPAKSCGLHGLVGHVGARVTWVENLRGSRGLGGFMKFWRGSNIWRGSKIRCGSNIWRVQIQVRIKDAYFSIFLDWKHKGTLNRLQSKLIIVTRLQSKLIRVQRQFQELCHIYHGTLKYDTKIIAGTF